MAQLISQRATCSKASVGAILVDPDTNHVASMGYNGAAPGTPHCIDVGCLLEDGHCRRTIHAEINALLNLERQFNRLILYCTHQPCYQCFKALVSAGVTEMYYIHSYADAVRDRLTFEKYPPVTMVKL